jgi:hypothetical protein
LPVDAGVVFPGSDIDQRDNLAVMVGVVVGDGVAVIVGVIVGEGVGDTVGVGVGATPRLEVSLLSVTNGIGWKDASPSGAEESGSAETRMSNGTTGLATTS